MVVPFGSHGKRVTQAESSSSLLGRHPVPGTSTLEVWNHSLVTLLAQDGDAFLLVAAASSDLILSLVSVKRADQGINGTGTCLCRPRQQHQCLEDSASSRRHSSELASSKSKMSPWSMLMLQRSKCSSAKTLLQPSCCLRINLYLRCEGSLNLWRLNFRSNVP